MYYHWRDMEGCPVKGAVTDDLPIMTEIYFQLNHCSIPQNTRSGPNKSFFFSYSKCSWNRSTLISIISWACYSVIDHRERCVHPGLNAQPPWYHTKSLSAAKSYQKHIKHTQSAFIINLSIHLYTVYSSPQPSILQRTYYIMVWQIKWNKYMYFFSNYSKRS